MNILTNKKFIYSGIALLIIILVSLFYFAFIKKVNLNSTTYEVMDSNVITDQIIRNNSLVKDSVLYSDQTNGTLQFSSKDKNFTLKLPKLITSPDYNRDRKMELENYAAEKLQISVDQLCVIPFSVESFTGEKLYTDVCLGEE